MFRPENVTRVGHDYRRTPSVYCYHSDDDIGIVLADDYFENDTFLFKPGDVIFTLLSDGPHTLTLRTSTTAAFESSLNTGWASYTDTTYVDAGTAWTLSADTDTILPNNKGIAIEFQMPPDIDTFYDGSVITGRNGDNLDVNTSASLDIHSMTFNLDRSHKAR